MASFNIGELTQSENEALLGLLIVLYRQDMKITMGEQDAFNAISEQMNWTSGTSLDNYLMELRAKVRDGDKQALVSEFMSNLSGRSEVNVIAQKMAESDGSVSAGEQQILDLIKDLSKQS
ncbi:hypothetical protein FLL45_08085 [Aliikangiella marina]|uniref:TerB family tellurite resistance protein n=1 Tax=Aliikangiella marina TaxID=1712262 RepID=A0A545TCG6_9GAMM|nr:hypothetical protein [Aliikangiella marina]TQV74910.1 hypothetical protein FLL45_08085 [Aliikangiella marina]